ncbi:hypothetical protein C8Q70DRAFT_306232 [Cubamyces menziesii]|nr:hypothetical protein C8Q70DRAFT_306232 [Cubamyces menziesii]
MYWLKTALLWSPATRGERWGHPRSKILHQYGLSSARLGVRHYVYAQDFLRSISRSARTQSSGEPQRATPARWMRTPCTLLRAF